MVNRQSKAPLLLNEDTHKGWSSSTPAVEVATSFTREGAGGRPPQCPLAGVSGGQAPLGPQHPGRGTVCRRRAPPRVPHHRR